MNRLISMTDFVLEQEVLKRLTDPSMFALDKIFKYANFLKQPLKLEMFVCCDGEGNVLKEPLINENKYSEKNISWHDSDILYTNDKLHYRQAQEKVLFSFTDYTIEDIKWMLHDFETIEELIGHNLTLTDYALKKIGI